MAFRPLRIQSRSGTFLSPSFFVFHLLFLFLLLPLPFSLSLSVFLLLGLSYLLLFDALLLLLTTVELTLRESLSLILYEYVGLTSYKRHFAPEKVCMDLFPFLSVPFSTFLALLEQEGEGEREGERGQSMIDDQTGHHFFGDHVHDLSLSLSLSKNLEEHCSPIYHVCMM